MIRQAINGLRLAWRPPPFPPPLLPPTVTSTIFANVRNRASHCLQSIGKSAPFSWHNSLSPHFTLLLVSFYFSSFFLGESKQGVWAGGIRDRERADVQRRDEQLLSLFPLPPCFLRPVIGSFPPPATLYIVQTLTPLTIISLLFPLSVSGVSREAAARLLCCF